VILNKFPYNNGHLMVVPNQHIADYGLVTPEMNAEIHLLAQRSIRALTRAYKPEGFNTGMNLGQAAGAGIKDHLHLHVIPRWVGDTNFLPVIGDVKCMPQHLLTSYDQIHEAFAKG
jgi:ATP adenylyltransferase